MLKSLEAVLSAFFGRFSVSVVEVDVVFREPCALPPLTSKLLKSAILSSPELSALGSLYSSSERPRRVVIGFLRGPRGRPLVAVDGGTEGFAVGAGEVLRGRLALVLDRASEGLPDLLGPLLSGPVEVSTPYCRVALAASEAVVVGSPPPPPGVAWGPSKGPCEDLRVTFVTPALISSKLAVPPWLPSASSRAPNVHRLLPTPGLVAAAALKPLLELAGSVGRADERLPYYALRYFDLTVAEVSYSLRPVTAVVGRDGQGRLRLARGFVGSVVYRPLTRKAARGFGVLMRVAELLGLGRSRASGFGEVRVEPLPRAGEA